MRNGREELVTALLPHLYLRHSNNTLVFDDGRQTLTLTRLPPGIPLRPEPDATDGGRMLWTLNLMAFLPDRHWHDFGYPTLK